MRLVPILLSFLLFLFGCSAGSESSNSLDISALLAQLEGQWVDATGYNEQWSIMENDTMWGEGLVIEHGELRLIEKLRIVNRTQVFVYQATVQGQNDGKTIGFPLVAANDSTLVFENQNHDFPNRISYFFNGDSSLKIRVESLSDTTRHFEIDLVKHK